MNNKKRMSKPFPKDKIKYPRKPHKNYHPYSWENQLYYRPVVPTEDTSGIPLLDKNNVPAPPAVISYYPVRKYGSPNRCWHKLDLQGSRKTHSLSGVSVIHN